MLRQLRTSSPDVSADLAALLDRSTRMAEGVDDAVAAILADVRARRDAAVAEYTRRFDKREPVDGSYELSPARWDAVTWDNFYWDGTTSSPTYADMTGTANNVQPTFLCGTNYIQPFVISSIIYDYSMRRRLRGM